jgi:hypothetical protein
VRGMPKQPGCAEKQGHQHAVQDHNLYGTGGIGHLKGDRAHQCLRQRRHEKCARHTARLESRNDCADESDSEHDDIKQVRGVIVLNSDKAGRSVEPDDQKYRREGESNRQSVCRVVMQGHHSSKSAERRRRRFDDGWSREL